MTHVRPRHAACLALLVPALAFACGDAAPGGVTPTPDAGATTSPDAAPAGSDGGGSDAPPPPPPGDGGTTIGPSGCTAIAIAAGAKVEGTAADTFTWSDADCHTRSAALLRNDATDAFGEHGGYLRAISYDANGATRHIKGTGNNGWQGFGYIIDHYANTASENQGFGGTYRTVLSGKHHAIHEFKMRVNPGGPVDVTAQWFFATGRSHPIFAITFDASPAGPNVVNADTRAPYGDLAWDDGKNGDVEGLGWGDSYAFTTTGSGPVTPHSPWDYTKKNVVPYAFEWSNATDAEMGLVATEAWASHVQGGDYGGGMIMSSWGKSGTDLLNDVKDWEWPFQLNQWELPFITSSHRVAWGTTYGAVGQSSYSAFGKTLSGYPFQSYSVYVVLGTHAKSAVGAAVSAIEAVQGAKLVATRGTVATDGVAGVSRTDKATFARPGFDPVYGAWTVDADANAATMTLDPGGAALQSPVLVLRGYTAAAPPSRVTVNGQALAADAGYFATVDAAGKRLWLTLDTTLTAAAEVSVQ